MINSHNLSIDKKDIDTILVLDFGSQYTQLIARRIRELKVFSIILPWDCSVEKIAEINEFLSGASGVGKDANRTWTGSTK